MNDRFQREMADDSRFDRLVDGALSPDEYKALLATLDDEPGGWRRCATAFLEDQAWRIEMGAIRRGQDVPPSSPKSPAAGTARRSWMPLLAVAATFVLAFAGGLVVRRQVDQVAGRGGGAAIEPEGNNVVQHPTLPDEDQAEPWQEPRSLGNIRLVVDGGEEQIEVPVYDQVDPEWLVPDEPALAPEIVEALARAGRRVERQVEYLPLPLDDGRQVVVPVEQYQITPVSRRSF